jgi:carboxyl-terminal processing protease
VKASLLKLHQERMKSSSDFVDLQEDIAEFAKRESETSITLNEARLKKEREEREIKSLERENKKRAAKGLAPMKKGETKPKEDIDFIRDEGLQIMADFIQIK